MCGFATHSRGDFSYNGILLDECSHHSSMVENGVRIITTTNHIPNLIRYWFYCVLWQLCVPVHSESPSGVYLYKRT